MLDYLSYLYNYVKYKISLRLQSHAMSSYKSYWNFSSFESPIEFYQRKQWVKAAKERKEEWNNAGYKKRGQIVKRAYSILEQTNKG